MKISQLIQLLESIQNSHGDIPIRCGQYRIGGIMVTHGQLGATAAFVPRKPSGSSLPVATGIERRHNTAKRRWDD